MPYRLLLLLGSWLLLTPVVAQTTLPIEGQVVQAAGGAPVPFATVGVRGQSLGSAADEQGRFRFVVPAAAGADTLVFSCLGYETARVPVAAFGPGRRRQVALRAVPTRLAAVTIRPGKVRTKTFGRTGSSTFMTSRLYTEPDLVRDELGREQGTVLRIDPDCRLLDLNFFVAFNRFRRVTFRLNLYAVRQGQPAGSLLTRDVLVEVTQPRGWVRVDLRPYQLQLQGHREVAVTLQWLRSEAEPGQSKAFGLAAVPLPGSSILFRDKSEAPWRTVNPGALSLYLTADSYGATSAPADAAPAAEYVLPDSLRYLQAARFADFRPTRHYGDSAAVGRSVAVAQGRLYYETYGAGEPLLLLHGNGQSIDALHAQIAALAPYFRVIAVDTRGHGRSPDASSKELTYELFATDVKQLLDSLHLRRVRVFGWSDGGNTALHLALRYPGYVERLAIFGANLFPGPEALEPSLVRHFGRQLRYAEQHADSSTARRLRLLLREPHLTFADLGAIRVPVLVLAGQHDVVREAHTRALAAALPQGQLRILPGASHYAPQEAAPEVNRLLLAFLRARPGQ